MTHRIACLSRWAWVVFVPAVFAQDIYRCGSTYSQVPCGDGRRFELKDARSDEQRRQALQVNERTVALAESLERDRLASEAAAGPKLAGSFNTSAKKISTTTPRSSAQAKPRKKPRLSAQAAKRRAPEPSSTQETVLAQPRH